MGNVFSPIKLRGKLAKHMVRISCITDLKDKLKPDYLLRISILWNFKDKLVLLIYTAIKKYRRAIYKQQ